MKEQLQRIIAELERLESDELTDDERRLLHEAKSRLILVWQGYGLRTRHGMIVSPLEYPMVQEFIDEETE